MNKILNSSLIHVVREIIVITINSRDPSKTIIIITITIKPL